MRENRIDSLESERSKAQRKRNQSLLVQSEAEMVANGSIHNFPVIGQRDGKTDRFQDHRFQLNSILRKTGQTILNQTTFPSAVMDGRMNSIQRFMDADFVKDNANDEQYMKQHQRLSKTKIKHLSNLVGDSQASKTDFSSMGHS